MCFSFLNVSFWKNSVIFAKCFLYFFFVLLPFFVALGLPENWLKSEGQKKTDFYFRIGPTRTQNRPPRTLPGIFFFFFFFLSFSYRSRVEFLNFQKPMFWPPTKSQLVTTPAGRTFRPGWKETDPVKNKKTRPGLTKKQPGEGNPGPAKKTVLSCYATWRIQEFQGPRICTAYSTSRTQGSGSSCQCVRSN